MMRGAHVPEKNVASGKGTVASRAWNEVLAGGGQMGEAVTIEMARPGELFAALRARQRFLIGES